MENPKEHEYWNGFINKIIRYWFYFTRGMDIINQFKLILAPLFVGIYLKNKSPECLFLITAISIPVTLYLGYISVHRMGKVIDWLNVKFSSHYSIASFELQKEIRDGITKLVEIHNKDNG